MSHNATVRGEHDMADMANEDPMLTPHGHAGQTRQIRISRGATVMATDGKLGAVHQIIMDQHTGELQALVIATGDTRQLEVPASHIARSDGNTVHLDVSLADLRLHPDLAKVYDPNQYVPVRENPFLPPSEAGREAGFTERPVVTNIERDAVGVVVPEPSTRKEDMVASMTTPEPEHYVPETPPPSVEAPLIAEPHAEPTVVDTHVVEEQPGGDEMEMEPAPHGSVNPRTGSVAGAIAAEGAPMAAAPAPISPEEREAVLSAQETVVADESAAPPEPAPEPVQEVVDDPANAAVPPVAADGDTIPDEPGGAEVAIPIVTSIPLAPEDEADEMAASPPGQVALDATDGSVGLENATQEPETEADVPAVEEEEAEVVEGSLPPVNPVNPGTTSDTIYDNQNTVSRVLNESERARTGSTMNRRGWGREGLTSSSNQMYGSRMTWVPAVALGALIVGLATWSTIRAIRRGRRKAVKAARNARLNVRESMLGAGRSAADMAQTVRANAQQLVASPQLMASDAISNFSDIPARYRWFRRGMRVGSRVERLRGKLS
jgi:hypothetical protein